MVILQIENQCFSGYFVTGVLLGLSPYPDRYEQNHSLYKELTKFTLGGMPKGVDPLTAPSHHTPDFYLDESGFKLGVEAMANITVDYIEMTQTK